MGRAIDGASFLPIFNDEPIRRTTPLYWQYNWARSEPKVAMRVGEWKILATLDKSELKHRPNLHPDDMQTIKTAELERFELYNLRKDIGETTERAEAEPGRLAAMVERLRPLYCSVRNESPVWPAWICPRYEAQRIEWPDYAE